MQDIKMIQTNTERRRKAKTGCELFLKLSPRRKISPPLTLAGQNDLTIKTKIGFLILLFRQTHNIYFCLFVFLSLHCCLDLILHGNSQYIFLSLCLSVCILSLRCCLDLTLHGSSQYIFLSLCLSVCILSLRCCLDLTLHGSSQYIFLSLVFLSAFFLYIVANIPK